MGGKKKSSKPPPKKKRPTVPKTFKCPFCDHDESCSCVMQKDSGIGKIQCGVCSAFFQTNITDLSDPIDVYSAWIDACEAANTAPDERERERDRDRSRGRDRERERERSSSRGRGRQDPSDDEESEEEEDED
eukprot:TRINITY_DN1334_c0_g1_i1.p1 TRINITY_DN1334_c0_g1~~TRINITY_DN1334_c0_g1_i1.p1  ORF type:complete len:132 (-),score=34.04 TRINITY_DN1334_c0_g1_i1:198-593(-)